MNPLLGKWRGIALIKMLYHWAARGNPVPCCHSISGSALCCRLNASKFFTFGQFCRRFTKMPIPRFTRWEKWSKKKKKPSSGSQPWRKRSMNWKSKGPLKFRRKVMVTSLFFLLLWPLGHCHQGQKLQLAHLWDQWLGLRLQYRCRHLHPHYHQHLRQVRSFTTQGAGVRLEIYGAAHFAWSPSHWFHAGLSTIEGET